MKLHWIAPFAVLLAPMIAVASPEAADAHGGHIVWISDIFGNKGSTGLLWILINFAVLLYILERILFAPLRAKTASKHDAVKTELEHATSAHQEAKSMVADYRRRLDGLQEESEALLEDAKARAQADRTRIIEAAEREAAQIRAAAKTAAERDADAHRRRLEAEVVEQAITRAEQIIRTQIQSADHRRMVDEYVGHLATVDLTGQGKRAGGAP